MPLRNTLDPIRFLSYASFCALIRNFPPPQGMAQQYSYGYGYGYQQGPVGYGVQVAGYNAPAARPPQPAAYQAAPYTPPKPATSAAPQQQHGQPLMHICQYVKGNVM